MVKEEVRTNTGSKMKYLKTATTANTKCLFTVEQIQADAVGYQLFWHPPPHKKSLILPKQRQNSLVPALIPAQLLARTEVFPEAVKFAFQGRKFQEKHL